MSKRTVQVAHAFAGMAFDDIRSRAARTLLALADEFGEPVPDGIRIRLRLSQRTLGALVAASRENVNRALAPLVAGGVISQSDGHFVSPRQRHPRGRRPRDPVTHGTAAPSGECRTVAT